MPLAQAIWWPQAKVSGLVLKIADFVPPPPVDFSLDQVYFLPQLVRLGWAAVQDFADPQSPVRYELKFDEGIYSTLNNYYDFELSEFAEGNHHLSLRACDSLNNCSRWSDQRQLIIDGTQPAVSLLANGLVVREAVGNDNWLLVGEGDFSAGEWQIGGDDSNGWLHQNYLQLDLDNQPQLSLVAFDYLIQSHEGLVEFDQPALEVLVNEHLVLIASRSTASLAEWQRAIVDLRQFQDSRLVIKIRSGNSGDQLLPTWAKVRNLTTKLVLVNDWEKLTLSVTDNLDQAASGQLILSDQQVGFFAKDAAGNATDLFYVPLVLDQQPPQFELGEIKPAPSSDQPTFAWLKLTDNLGLADWSLISQEGGELGLELFANGLAYDQALSLDSEFWLKIPSVENEAGLREVSLKLVDLAGNQIIEPLNW